MTFEGVLSIDKPAGLTSHDVINRLRKVAAMRRIGHAGTLDPLATGVLLVCLGRATRLVEYLVGQPKTYTAVIKFGQSTNTYDADGEVVRERPLTFSTDDLTEALSRFQGDIQQLPPAYSAIKIKGQPMYKLARKGIDVERKPRAVTIYQLTVSQFNPPLLEIDVVCSSGTYIRSLAHDLGELLGCGGHIAALRRTAVGEFGVETAVPLANLTPENLNSYCQPPNTAVRHLPSLHITKEQVIDLWQGKAVEQVEPYQAGLACAYAPEGTFVGIVRADKQIWLPHKMFPPV